MYIYISIYLYKTYIGRAFFFYSAGLVGGKNDMHNETPCPTLSKRAHSKDGRSKRTACAIALLPAAAE